MRRGWWRSKTKDVSLPEENDPEVGLYPDLTFYYGLSFESLCTMPRWAVSLYARSLHRLLAERQLMAIEASSVPYMKQEDATRLIRDLKGRLEYSTSTSPTTTPMSLEQYQMQAAMAGIGITFEGEEGGDAVSSEEGKEVN